MKGIDSFWVHLTRFLTPCTRGVKITKIAIAYKHGVQSFRPFWHLFRYVFARGSNSSHASAFASLTSGDVDTFLRFSCSRSWYVFPYRSKLCSHVFYIVWSRLNPLQLYEHCCVRLCGHCFNRWVNSFLHCPSYIPLVQRVLDSLGIHNPMNPACFHASIVSNFFSMHAYH